MAQQVKIAGATYSDVPKILVPDANDVYHPFTDVSDTTATASDVASGKVFYLADGSQAIGTSSGGSVMMGVLRPDAELVNSWSDDYMLVEDGKVTIPAYSTSSATLVASTDLATYTASQTTYNYFVAVRCLTIPQYATGTSYAKGREEYCYTATLYEYVYHPANSIKSLDGTKSYQQYTQVTGVGAAHRLVYWSSGTAITPYTSNAYGLAQGVTGPTIGSNTTITIKSPTVTIRGHTTYLTQTFFEAIEDARIQYVIELWRVPRGSINGWGIISTFDHITNDLNNGGTLT